MRAAVGLTVKSGWASAVLLTGSATSPRVVDSRKIELSDPEIPETRQPYHAGFGTARGKGAELSRLVTLVKRCGRRSVTELIQHYKAGQHLRGVGIVVGSLIDPSGIANEHIRIHALEGQLFRGVVQDAVARSNLACCLWRERDLYASAASYLERSEDELRKVLTAVGRAAAGPWRAEQKAATLAAWLVLSSARRLSTSNQKRLERAGQPC